MSEGGGENRAVRQGRSSGPGWRGVPKTCGSKDIRIPQRHIVFAMQVVDTR